MNRIPHSLRTRGKGGRGAVVWLWFPLLWRNPEFWDEMQTFTSSEEIWIWPVFHIIKLQATPGGSPNFFPAPASHRFKKAQVRGGMIWGDLGIQSRMKVGSSLNSRPPRVILHCSKEFRASKSMTVCLGWALESLRSFKKKKNLDAWVPSQDVLI